MSDYQDSKLFKIRHSAAHILAYAVKNLYKDVKVAIGPVIDEGFYYDFDFGTDSITEQDLEKIEKEMKKIISKGVVFKQEWVDTSKAKEIFKDEPYKLEIVEEISKGDREDFGKKGQVSIYTSGEFVDLCKGPHIDESKDIKAIKLLNIAGAYWKGDEKNKMLTRIYGTAFERSEDLKKYLEELEKRKENDHRVLGQKLDLFCFSDMVGKGLVMYTPKGTAIKNTLKEELLKISKKYGVQEVNIPHLAKIELYETSGHAQKFSDELFRVQTHYDEEFVLKPVNCPHHTQIYASRQRSYRDLPIRYIESTQQHRDEKPGALGGLNRTRSFEIDDGHTFCTPQQIKQEVINTVKIIEEFYKSLDMWDGHWVSLSFRDKEHQEKYIGDVQDWENAEKMLQEVSDELKLNGKVMEGEAALYGPKIDFMKKDAMGNDRQLGTVQVDFAMPKRFKLTYIDEKGEEKTPVMMHRAILGSYGRFIANLLETTAGAFPVWLSPVQVQVIPISDKVAKYASEIKDKLENEDIKVEIDDRDETMQNKIRKAQEQKVPYMVIVGEREEKNNEISLRTREGKQYNNLSMEEFVEKVKSVIESKNLNLWE